MSSTPGELSLKAAESRVDRGLPGVEQIVEFGNRGHFRRAAGGLQ